MANTARHSTLTLDSSLRRLVVALTLVGALMFGAQLAQAQTFTVLHNFTGGLDGGSPYAGLSAGRGGTLYGTTSAGGRGYGTVFELSHRRSGWVFEPIFGFAGGADGEGPTAGVIIGADGSLYGTTYAGGLFWLQWRLWLRNGFQPPTVTNHLPDNVMQLGRNSTL